jgi:hypothetical protein
MYWLWIQSYVSLVFSFRENIIFNVSSLVSYLSSYQKSNISGESGRKRWERGGKEDGKRGRYKT